MNYAQPGALFMLHPDSERVSWYEEVEYFLNWWDNYPGEQIDKIANDIERRPQDIDRDLFDCMSDAMAELAPPGHYFGEARHDDGVFGFWPVPECYQEVRS